MHTRFCTITREGRTRAAQLVDRIESSILSGELPAGTVLGSARDLGERYDVGQPVVREAFRMLECSGLARPRRGLGGG